MVSDSVMRGMATAVEQAADEKIAAKDLELANLKKCLHSSELITIKYVGNLVRQQFNVCEKETAYARRSNSIKQRCSTSLQQDFTLSAKLEDMVIQTVLRSLHEEFYGHMLELDALFTGIYFENWLEKFDAISSINGQLSEIQKALSNPDTSVISHESHDFDPSQQRIILNHATLPTSVLGENGTLDLSNIHEVESYDFLQLKHMTKEELVIYFNNAVTKMRRDHESAIQVQTEKYFSLKREYLKVSHHRKDEEFHLVRKKLHEIIPKIEDFLIENQRFPVLKNTLQSVGKLNHRIDSLLSENHHLRILLTEKEDEIKSLLAEVSDLRENVTKTIQESSERAEAISAENGKTDGIESLLMLELSGSVCTDFMRNAIGEFSKKIEDDREVRFHLQNKIAEKENELQLEIEEKKMMKQELLDLETTLKQIDNPMEDILISLSKEREQFELASCEINRMSEDIRSLKILASETNSDLEMLRCKYLEALEEVEADKMEMYSLRSQLDETEEVLTRASNERNQAFALVDEMREKLLEYDTGKESVKKVLQKGACALSVMLDDFKSSVSLEINRSNLKLQDASYQLKALSKMANELKRTELMYKHTLERRCADLELAEAEVDLLGDQVDVLSSLLEKIYIGLEHYSPVLLHYTGIMEILKMIRRELMGESRSTEVCSTEGSF